MNWILTVIIIVVSVFAFFLLFKVIRKIMMIVLTVLFILFLSLAVFSYFLYQDAQQLDAEFANSTNLYLFDEQGIIKYGFRAKGFGLVDKDMLIQEEINELQLYYEEEDYDAIISDDYYKLILFKKENLEEKNLTEIQLYFDEQFLQSGPALLFNGIREGDVLVYPETLFFRTVEFIPEALSGKMRMFE